MILRYIDSRLTSTLYSVYFYLFIYLLEIVVSQFGGEKICTEVRTNSV